MAATWLLSLPPAPVVVVRDFLDDWTLEEEYNYQHNAGGLGYYFNRAFDG